MLAWLSRLRLGKGETCDMLERAAGDAQLCVGDRDMPLDEDVRPAAGVGGGVEKGGSYISSSF